MWDQEITPLKKNLSVQSRKFSVIAELARVSEHQRWKKVYLESCPIQNFWNL